MLKLVEVEFKSREAAEAFIKPAWFGEEVTEDMKYKNRTIAMNLIKSIP